MEMTNFNNIKQANFHAALLAVVLDRSGAEPLHVQLTTALRRMILNGQAHPGQRLPASRQLTADLSVSRSTVLTALDQLTAEGYLTGRRGSGTFVADSLPHLSPPVALETKGVRARGSVAVVPFHPSAPDMRAFPHAAWARHLEAVWREPEPGLVQVADPLGWPPLREAIAAHLRAWRGISSAAGQVVITSGAAESFALIAQLLPVGSEVHIEDPSFATMRRQVECAGLICRAQAVDGDGFDPSRAGRAAAAIVTPSRHFPLGMTMPVARRLALLEWAREFDALIVEDDYDSEFRYSGQPLPALTSLDREGRTIYAGSFSKLLSPALRLGYLVVPARLLDAVTSALEVTGSQASLIPQPALARFMESGEFAIHLRRMRRLYGRRRKALAELIGDRLEGWLIPDIEPSGMHLVCGLGPELAHLSDREVAARANAVGVDVRAVPDYCAGAPTSHGVILGYAGFTEDELARAVELLASVLEVP